MKKLTIFSIVLLSLLLFFVPVGFASQPNVISPETLITEENIEDVVKHFGLDSSNIIKLDKNTNNTPTVRELEMAIEMAKQMPASITDIYNERIPNDEKFDTEISPNNGYTNTMVAVQDSTYGDTVMRYLATGKYYRCIHYAYWISAENADIRVISSAPGIATAIDEVRLLTINVHNPRTTNSYLRMNYDYTLGHYLIVQGSGIKVGEQDISGWRIFNDSYLYY